MSPWTAREIFLRVWKSIRRDPVALLLSLALLPSVWTVPIRLAYATWIPEGSMAFGSQRSERALVLSFVAVVWDAIWAGGSVRIAVDAARGRSVRFRHLLEGVAYTPWIVCTACTLLPLELVALLPLEEDPGTASVAVGAVLALTIVLMLRTALWSPFLLDAGTSIGAGLSASWNATRERSGQMLLLAALLTAPILPVAYLEITLSGEAYVATGLTSLVYTLAVGHLYTLAHDRPERSLQQA